MSRKLALRALMILVLAYLVIAAAYAINTPPWQAPDEPAHYNYIRYIAEHGALPVLQNGDYAETYNEEFVRTPQNTQSMSIDPFRYEFYSPPLYYLLASPLYSLTTGSIVALRLFSVALSALLIIVAYLIGTELFPDRLQIALGAAAFVAFVPQHVAMMSAVNNDSLAELLIALCIWQSMRLFKTDSPSRKSLFLLGVTLGWGLLTKQTVYYTALPIVFIALALHWGNAMASGAKQSLRQSTEIASAQNDAPPNDASHVTSHPSHISRYALSILPAVALGAILWLHNIQVYGGFDVLGLARHNSIVVGQPTTADWIAQYGLGGLLSRGLSTTFHSFWGQFGWMAVPMQNSDYLMAGILSLVAFVGWLWWIIRPQTKDRRPQLLRPQAIVLILLVALTFGGFIYYNLTFVQHQGRYLFPALIPIGLMVSIGLDQILRKLFGLIKNQNRWITLARLVLFALVFVYLARLDIIALQRYIIPVLTP